MAVENNKVGGEYGGGNFAAVGAVAEERGYEAGGCGGLVREETLVNVRKGRWEIVWTYEGKLYSTAETGGCCSPLFGPAIFGAAGKRDEGIGITGGVGHSRSYSFYSSIGQFL